MKYSLVIQYVYMQINRCQISSKPELTYKYKKVSSQEMCLFMFLYQFKITKKLNFLENFLLSNGILFFETRN